MAEIVVAVDETAATDVLHDAQTTLGTLHEPPVPRALGPFTATCGASATFSGGGVDLLVPDLIRITDLRMDWSVTVGFSFDLSSFLPDIHLPSACVDIPCVGRVCTPQIDIDWPTVTVGPLSFSDFVKTTADFRLDIRLVAGTWVVEAVVVGVPFLQLGPASALIVTGLGLAVAAALAPIPFIGPFLAVGVAAVTAGLGVAAVTGLLGPLLTPFVAGLRLPLYEQPQDFVVLPAAGPLDPQVDITLDAVRAEVLHRGGEDELVLSIDVSP